MPRSEVTGHRVDLRGATVLPGLVDAHVHLPGLGMAARLLDLRGAATLAETLERVRHAALEANTGDWIRGRGWDQNHWPEARFPDAAQLNAVAPDHPVFLERIDGHAVWANSAAMAAAGIDENTESLPGGEILRDSAGAPTGILIDNAIGLLRTRLPPPNAADLRADLLHALSLCREAGLTGVHDMTTTAAELEQLRAVEAEGLLTLRIHVYLDDADPATAPLLAAEPDREGLLRVVGVKLFSDGALGSRGAYLLEPYADRPETRGLLVTAPAELARRAQRIHERGYQLAIHAIGDAGVRCTLDAIEAAQRGNTKRRHRVEHAQIVAPADRPRFAALGAVASMQPIHATSDMPWTEAKLGPDRIPHAYAWRALLDAGALLALGSDAPVEAHHPWHGIHAAVTRQDAVGAPVGGWVPEQRLTVEEAIAGYTTGPRLVVGEAGGMLRVGAPADLTVVAHDPTAVPPGALRDTQTLRTVVDGREVWSGDPLR